MGSVIEVDQMRPDEAALGRALAVLRDEGVLVMPTDSVYGIGCAATAGNPAHRRIFEIKRRDPAQTLPWLVGSPDALDAYGAGVPAWMRDLAREFWPGALTLVVPSSAAVPEEYRRPGDGTIGLRMPASPLVCELAARLGAPLATTSANTHGAPSPASGAGLEPRIVAEADLVLDSGAAPKGVASTVVGVDASGRPLVFREGFLSRERVAEVAGA